MLHMNVELAVTSTVHVQNATESVTAARGTIIVVFESLFHILLCCKVYSA